jgi:hypothetical protein
VTKAGSPLRRRPDRPRGPGSPRDGSQGCGRGPRARVDGAQARRRSDQGHEPGPVRRCRSARAAGGPNNHGLRDGAGCCSRRASAYAPGRRPWFPGVDPWGAMSHGASTPRGHHQASEGAADPEHRREHEYLFERSAKKLAVAAGMTRSAFHERDADHAGLAMTVSVKQHVMNGQAAARPRSRSGARRLDRTSRRGGDGPRRASTRRPRSRQW